MRLQFSHAVMASVVLHIALAGGVGWIVSGRAQTFGKDESFVVAVTALSAESLANDNGEAAAPRSSQPDPIRKPEEAPLKISKQSTYPKESLRPKAEAIVEHAEMPPRSIGSKAVGDGDGGNGGGERARILRAPRPEYPFRARQAGFEGKVTLDVTIAADGSVEAVRVLEGSGRADCDQAARITLKDQWQFAPAILSGEPVRSNERVVVRFQLIANRS